MPLCNNTAMNIAIYEDNREFAERLERYICQYTHFPPAINTGRRDELEQYVTGTVQPTLYFLDIVLDGTDNGFAIAERIAERKRSDLIVFLTAYKDRIIGNPFHLTKAYSVIFKDSQTLTQEIAATIDLAKQSLADKCLLRVIGKSENLYIPFDSILYIEHIKGSNKVCIHCTEGRYTVRDTLTAIHSKLDERFARCHHAYIVNRGMIARIDKSDGTVHFMDGSACPYSQLMRGNLYGKQT